MCRYALFLARGTLGDVAPLLALASAWARSAPSPCHDMAVAVVIGPAQVLEALLEAFPLPNLAPEGRLILQRLHTSSDVHGDDADPSEKPAAARKRKLSDSDSVCQSTRDGLVMFDMCARFRAGASVIIHNLFAWEAASIAEKMGVPAIAASPFLLARPPPTGFFSCLEKEYPELSEALKSAEPGTLSNAHVDHWIWRQFMDDVGELRDCLGLVKCPFVSETGKLVHPLPRAPYLLYGLCSSMVKRQAYWPESVALCGFWHLDSTLDKREGQLPALVDDFLRKSETVTDSSVVFVSMGSMETLSGVLPSSTAKSLASALLSAILERGDKAIVQVNSSSQFSHAWKEALQNTEEKSDILMVSGFLSHEELFKRCHVIVHHGGAGTVGMALRVGKPQIICPFMFDQHYWADQLRHLGVAPVTVPPLAASRRDFSIAFEACTQQITLDNARRLAGLQNPNALDETIKRIKDICKINSSTS